MGFATATRALFPILEGMVVTPPKKKNVTFPRVFSALLEVARKKTLAPDFWPSWNPPSYSQFHLSPCVQRRSVSKRDREVTWKHRNLCKIPKWVFPKIWEKSPNHPFVHRVWNHYFNHPFWGFSHPYFLVQQPNNQSEGMPHKLIPGSPSRSKQT